MGREGRGEGGARKGKEGRKEGRKVGGDGRQRDLGGTTEVANEQPCIESAASPSRPEVEVSVVCGGAHNVLDPVLGSMLYSTERCRVKFALNSIFREQTCVLSANTENIGTCEAPLSKAATSNATRTALPHSAKLMLQNIICR